MKTKGKKRCGLLAAVVMLVLINAASIHAASAAQYKTYISNHLVPSTGITRTGSWTIPYKYEIGNWLDAKGVLTAYPADLNGDRKKECLVVYFTKEAGPVAASWYNRLHIAVYSDLSGSIRKTSDVKLHPVASGLKMDTRIFVKTKGKKKYLAVQNFGGIDGLSCHTYIFHVTAKDRIYLDKLFIDPGFTSGVGLYVSNKKGIVTDLSSESYSNGTPIFNKDMVSGAGSQTGYRDAMNKYLKSFGLSVSKRQIWKGLYTWMLKKDSSMKYLSYMKSKIVRNETSSTMTITVKDFSKWR